jgi:hydroxymethylpyrimidine pyrophosphatase-like HAD family hydrolase
MLNRLFPAFIADEQARQAWDVARVVVVPGNGGRRTYELLRNAFGRPTNGLPRVLNVPVVRERARDGTPQVILPSEARDMLSCFVSADSDVLIVDDVASTYQTIAEVTSNIRARSLTILTLLATDLRKEEYLRKISVAKPMIILSGGVVVNRSGDPVKTPGITTTAGLLDDTLKAVRSRTDLGTYLQGGSAPLELLAERRRGDDLQLLLLDLDGTSLINGVMPDELRELLTTNRDRFFAVAATGRNAASYRSLPREIQAVFRASILDDGLTIGINGSDMPMDRRNVNEREVQKRLDRAARTAGVQILVTRRASSATLPWCVRVRAAGNDVQSCSFVPEDTQAAFRFAALFDNDKRFSLLPSGYGDATLTWKGYGKGTSGIGGLARMLPTLPSLATAVAAGDGPNDRTLLQRVKEAGGTAIAVNPACSTVCDAANEILADPRVLAGRLRRMFTLS